MHIMAYSVNFGSRIRLARQMMGGLGQEEFSELLGVRVQQVSRWENNKSFPTGKAWEDLCRVCRKPLLWFFLGDRNVYFNYPENAQEIFWTYAEYMDRELMEAGCEYVAGENGPATSEPYSPREWRFEMQQAGLSIYGEGEVSEEPNEAGLESAVSRLAEIVAKHEERWDRLRFFLTQHEKQQAKLVLLQGHARELAGDDPTKWPPGLFELLADEAGEEITKEMRDIAASLELGAFTEVEEKRSKGA